MARWSDAMKFDIHTLEIYQKYLGGKGVYELGFVRNDVFSPKYIGESHKRTLYLRLRTYFQASRKNEIPPQLMEQLYNQRNMVWFHVFSCDDPESAEMHMLRREGIGQDRGLYEWNRQYEN